MALPRPFRRLLDAAWLMVRHWRDAGTWPNPVRPRTLNDWVMRRLILKPEPLHAQLSCKLGQRRFKAERIGEAASPPLLGAWDTAEALARAWDGLPDAFMLKPTHASGWYRAVPDKTKADRAAILAEAAGWLGRSYYAASREIGYRDVVPRLIAEPLLPAPAGLATPWEICLFCYDGRIAVVCASATRTDGLKTLLFLDAAARLLPIGQAGRPTEPLPPLAPAEWLRIRDMAQRLTAGIDFLRCDFLLEGERAWASEVTCYPAGGRSIFEPWSWVVWLGEVWTATRDGRPWPEPPARAEGA